MHPIEFITEFCGIAKVLGPDEVPTPAQWKRIHEMLQQVMGPLAARKLLELGEEAERQKELELTKLALYQELCAAKAVPQPVTLGNTSTISTPYVTYSNGTGIGNI